MNNKQQGNIEIERLYITRKTSAMIYKEFCSIDLETTGLNPNKDEIVEIGAVKFINGKKTELYNALVKSKVPISKEATAVNHITNKMLKEIGTPSNIVYAELSKFFERVLSGDVILTLYNADFDLPFLKKALENHGYSGKIRYIDAYVIAKVDIEYGDIENYKQATVAKYLNIPEVEFHRALPDAMVCGQILLKLTDGRVAQYQAEDDLKNAHTPNDTEMEACAIILNVLKQKEKVAVSKCHVYKDEDGYVLIREKKVFIVLKYESNQLYVYVPKYVMPKKMPLEIENCSNDEDPDRTVKILIGHDLFKLEEISSLIIRLYKKYANRQANPNDKDSSLYDMQGGMHVYHISVHFLKDVVKRAKDRLEEENKKEEILNVLPKTNSFQEHHKRYSSRYGNYKEQQVQVKRKFE